MTDTVAPEIGKCYRTRDGYKCGPISYVAEGLAGFIAGTGLRVFDVSGKHAYGNAELDLVAEWVDEASADFATAGMVVKATEITPAFVWSSFGGLPEAAPKGTYFRDPSGQLRVAKEDLDKGPAPWLEYDGDGAWRGPQSGAEKSYAEIRTHVPPVLALEHGELVIKLMADNLTLVASVGDGRFFFAQIIEKLVDPALLKAHKAAAFLRDIASPND